MIHRLENGDVVKLLPIITEKNEIKFGLKYHILVLNNKFLYDTNDYLKKCRSKYGKLNTRKPGRINEDIFNKLRKIYPARYAFNAYINGEIKTIIIGRGLINIIANSDENALDIRSDNHLIIVKNEVTPTVGITVPSFEHSYISNIPNWIPPVNDINSKEEWITFIKNNQYDFIGHMNNNSVVNNRSLLANEFGIDIISELINEEREKKLQEILN